MLLKFIISVFKTVDEESKSSKLETYPHPSSSPLNNKGTTVILGLKIVAQISQGIQKSNIVVMKPPPSAAATAPPSISNHQLKYSCYLNSCHLCSKILRLDREVYMYRGDQGFCSVECRDRQILINEMKEFEASRKRTRSQSRTILEELRRERSRSSSSSSHHDHKEKPQDSQKIHWAIIA